MITRPAAEHVATPDQRDALLECDLPYLTVRFSPELLAAVLGRSWVDDHGRVITVARIWWDDDGTAVVETRSTMPTRATRRRARIGAEAVQA